MRFTYTKHQVARGALPDSQDRQRICLVKNVTMMRATYQVRLLMFLASEAGKKLVIFVPQHCKLHPSLNRLIAEFSKTIYIERTK